MPIPHRPRNGMRGNCPQPATPATPPGDWTCLYCGKLLGILRGDRLHLRLGRSHEYHVSLPVTCTCRGCGTLNHADGRLSDGARRDGARRP